MGYDEPEPRGRTRLVLQGSGAAKLLTSGLSSRDWRVLVMKRFKNRLEHTKLKRQLVVKKQDDFCEDLDLELNVIVMVEEYDKRDGEVGKSSQGDD
jgi:hypothetical protein